eukprot:CAMPEP_0114593326 /NCGR_PEP_ID=MMETSP0125-20121206/14942_1 /TAXON_ID=485358 ORGANISM="Aristerostoma sp., Strain ATCC 50986" /NCGR_SAMPLE_ID=MMETSP0125 /ASSEMBLY_ACC=CAM_ASM_000245 /LENGTH=109 /DNA_ID=CAMNT_0001792437 /DNA_START=69 /DNA_END=398 /DNA_ORIENTATION=-
MASYDSPLYVEESKLRWAYGFLTLENEEAEAKAFIEKHSDFKLKTVRGVKVLQTNWIDFKEGIFEKEVPQLYGNLFEYAGNEGLLKKGEESVSFEEYSWNPKTNYRFKI